AAEDGLDPLRLTAYIVVRCRVARGVVRPGEVRRATQRCGDSVYVERVDEDARVGRHELRRAADARGDDGAPAGHRLEQRLAEGFQKARLTDDMSARDESRDELVRHPTQEVDPGAALERAALRSVARKGEPPLAECRKCICQPDDVLPLGERAETEKARRPI